MRREVVLERTPLGVRAGLLEDGVLVEVAIERDDAASIVDRILLARVRAIDHRLDAAFVECGRGQDVLLGARDARHLTGCAPGTPIARQLHEGQTVLVQGRRDAAAGKGPRVTGDIALAGTLLVLHPRRRDCRLSERLARRPEAKAVRERLRHLLPDGGIVLRSAGRTAADAALTAEAERLRERWRRLEQRAAGMAPPAQLDHPAEPLARVLRAWISPLPSAVITAERALLARARTLLEQLAPDVLSALEHRPDAFAASGAAEQLAQALEREVPLAGGGTLTIEPTAALVAIDVDGAGRPPLEADLEAAITIARQIRLRALAGTIVIDFAGLPRKGERERVVEVLRRAFVHDPEPVRVWPMTALGLVALSRRRRGPSLTERLGRVCPVCAGEGRLASLDVRLEDLAAELVACSGRAACVRLADDLDRHVRADGAAVWQQVRERLHQMPSICADPTLAPGSFVIETRVRP